MRGGGGGDGKGLYERLEDEGEQGEEVSRKEHRDICLIRVGFVAGFAFGIAAARIVMLLLKMMVLTSKCP